MKKNAFIFILLAAVLTFCSALAERTVTYYIPEYEISVDVPVNIICVTRDSDKTNMFYQSKYIDYDIVHQDMLNHNYYLYGMTIDFSAEFSVAIVDYNDEDFNSLNNSSLSIISTQINNVFSDLGAMDLKSDIYQGKKDKAIRTSYTYRTQERDSYVLIYITAHDSKLLYIRFIPFYTEISDQQKALVQDIFDSIAWESKPYTTEDKGQTDLNIYTDYETGLSFMVPTGWNEVKFLSNEDYKKVKYRIGTNNVWVEYESGDFWDFYKENFGELIDTFKMTRKDFDNKFLTTELVADLLGCSEENVSITTIGDQEYFCMNNTYSYTSENLTIDTQDLVYICLRDANLYWFQLSGIDLPKYENQFNRFMKTVEFP